MGPHLSLLQCGDISPKSNDVLFKQQKSHNRTSGIGGRWPYLEVQQLSTWSWARTSVKELVAKHCPQGVSTIWETVWLAVVLMVRGPVLVFQAY